MEQKRSIRLVLKTSDLTANSTTAIGQCDQYKTTFTWFNINLRNLLGDQYNQYDYFNMTLTNMACSAIATAVGANAHDDRIVSVKISGLPFINQTYNQPTGNNSTFATIAIYNIPTAVNTANNQFFNNYKIKILKYMVHFQNHLEIMDVYFSIRHLKDII